MKLITFEYDGLTRIGVLSQVESGVISAEDVLGQIGRKSMTDFIAAVTPEQMNLLRLAASGSEENDICRIPRIPCIPTEEIQISAPITRPIHDILCVGVNYRSHLEETEKWLDEEGFKPPKSIYFTKRACRITGSGGKISAHADLDEKLDYEVELAVIIGKKCRDVKREGAEDVIFGYSVFNDFSARTLQQDHVQWAKGKSLDTFSAMGPVILTKEELPFPVHVDVICSVNDEVRQHSNTRLFLNDIPGIIEDLSAGMTLEPGDIIATGTPSGVAMGMAKPAYLKAGDKVECRIPEIGSLINYIE